MKALMSKQENISWLQFNNTVPIIASAVMIAGSFFALKSDVALLSQKLDRLSEDTKEIITDNRGSADKLNDHETRITLLENKKISTGNTKSSLASKSTPAPQVTIQQQTPESDNSSQPVTVNQVQEVKPEPTPQPRPEPTPSIPLVSPILEALGARL